jgi:hypothetical protein
MERRPPGRKYGNGSGIVVKGNWLQAPGYRYSNFIFYPEARHPKAEALF